MEGPEVGYKATREVAEALGVTARAIQRHVKKHPEELQDHVIYYPAPRGMYLDDYAQDFISKLLVRPAVAIMDASLQDETERLRKELDEAQKRIIDLLERSAELQQKALEAETAKELAAATQQDQARRIQELEAALTEAKDETLKLKNRTLWQRIRRWGE